MMRLSPRTGRRERRLPIARCVVLMVLASPAGGQQAKPEPEAVELPSVQVEGKREGAAPEARPDSRVTGDELRQRRQGTLGATLQDELGVANSSFGPSVGLPVIRGLTGPRVRILVDGIGAHDASSASPDHAITVDPLAADEIRLLRGANTVRYGSGAIGGAVEVIDNRIPSKLPKTSPTGAIELRSGSNGPEHARGFKLDAGAGMFAFHADGFLRERGIVRVPAFAIDDAAIRSQFGLNNQENTFGHVPNTNARSRGMSIGGSLIGSRGFIGFAVNDMVNNYGIPPAGHAHSDVPGQPPAADAPRIDMKQTRHDIKGELLVDRGPVERIALRIGRVDYQHAEVDGNVVQTTFTNDVLEGRLEIEHRVGPRLTGILGLTEIDRNFAALGAEAFVPQTSVRTAAGYLIQRLDLSPVRFELGLRRERQVSDPRPQFTVFRTTVVLPKVVHVAESVSATASLELAPRTAVTLGWSRAKRNPDVQELYALGPHVATRSFDIGNARLRREVIEGIDLGAATDLGVIAARLNVYRNRAQDYIYQRNAGLFYDPDVRRFRAACVRIDECLPVLRYEQADAMLKGYEGQVVWRALETSHGLLELKVFSDYLRAHLTSRPEDIPRIPPRRYGVEIALVSEQWMASLRHQRTRAQLRAGLNETPTAASESLALLGEYRFRARGLETVLFVQGRNLLDREIRNATSFLRNYTPEPGRTIEMGMRTSF